jgi:template-activating factor I
LVERRAQAKLADVYARRRAVTKAIPKFWAIALMNNQKFLFQAQHHTDQMALSYLEDVWVIRDPDEPRCFTIEFVSVIRFEKKGELGLFEKKKYFKENPFFADKVLRKEFKNIRERVPGEGADEDGITDSMLDFTFEVDVEPSVSCVRLRTCRRTERMGSR